MSKHTEHSSFREKLIEHLFVGELLKHSWQNGDCQIEVAKPEVDNSGYDLIAEANGIVRHIQLKTSFVGGKASRQKVHIKLAKKPSGCVIWIIFNEVTLVLEKFYFFGGCPGEPLPAIKDKKTAMHTKGNKDGLKAERPNIRELNKGDFKPYKTLHEIYGVLFSDT